VYAAQQNPPLVSNNQGAIIFILCDVAAIGMANSCESRNP
jgi:hypothetical protein